jgi:hypothetical protein
MKRKHLILIVAAFILPFVYSCKKEKKTSPIQIYLTDNPTVYDSVNVHIKNIEVNILQDTEGWIPINTKDTIVNLLDLKNGITMLLADDIVPQGVLKEVRFVLGGGNYVVVNGVAYPMQTPSAESSGLKVKIDKTLNEAFNAFILDFDAEQSILEENGSYKLEPVIRLTQ